MSEILLCVVVSIFTGIVGFMIVISPVLFTANGIKDLDAAYSRGYLDHMQGREFCKENPNPPKGSPKRYLLSLILFIAYTFVLFYWRLLA